MLFALGSNGSAQLGVGHSHDIFYPCAVALEDVGDISQVVSGGNHTIILLANGHVLGCGSPEAMPWMRIPDVSEADSDEAIKLPQALQILPGIQLQNVAQVAATWTASFFLTHDGNVLACGHGDNGELGLGVDIRYSPFPQPIPNFPPPGTRVRSLTSGMAHTAAILDNGTVYGWGRGRHGQLGKPLIDVWLPKIIHNSSEFLAVAAACGKDFTCLIEREESGRILLLGLQKRDRFRVHENAPTAVPSWKSIVATWGGVYILKTSGQLVAWGRDDHGQMPSIEMPLLRAVAAGSEHCIAVTTNKDILAWGWGEHGNCGLPIDSAGNVTSSWNTLLSMDLDECCEVYAGCATSFVKGQIR